MAEEGERRLCVIGAGTMGHGIAQAGAAAGWLATLVDTTPAMLERALERITANLDAGVERGKVTAEERTRVLKGVHATTDLAAAVGGAGVVVEAVPERLELKLSVFRDVEAHASKDALLATNTSSLSVTALQEGLAGPERVVGLHFFNPVHIMKLVEVIRGRHTAEVRVQEAVGFARELGKDPIVVNDSPGFASSRLGIALGMEAIRMLEQGVASAEDIDKAMELGYRHPMGPLRLTDLVGLDVRLSIAEYLHETLGAEQFRPPELLRRMVSEGRLGKKSGQGFYTWSE